MKDLPEDEEGEEEETGLFIPFPGTTKQLKPKPYRGSDPEWQEFINFSKDKELARKVRDELAAFVRQLADKHPVLSLRCGNGMKLRRYWLDVDFPTHPPPEFERSGYVFTSPVECKTNVSQYRNHRRFYSMDHHACRLPNSFQTPLRTLALGISPIPLVLHPRHGNGRRPTSRPNVRRPTRHSSSHHGATHHSAPTTNERQHCANQRWAPKTETAATHRRRPENYGLPHLLFL